MDRQRFERVEAIFHEVLEAAPERREDHLKSACAGQPDLEVEVRSLLGAHLGEPGLLDRPAPFPTADPEAVWIGERIGHYRLAEQIGHGGMGIVFRADRIDEEYQQTVALKLIGHRIVKEELLRRFRNERQILANLQHPNIAQLLDGGTTAEGQPYLVMEFVEGRPITAYCDEKRLPVEARLDLFRKVCKAVAYAHQNLVIHRDLKPSNIFVTTEGDVKLLDFGIAKALGDGDRSTDSTLTASTQSMMTPNWASPEQIQGKPLSTASDIYSLGVLLFTLLCGRPPHAATSFVELLQSVVEKDPPRPSAALDDVQPGEAPTAIEISSRRSSQPARLRRRLEGDLDVITLQCLQKDPVRRYDSAHDLASDIHRHLRGLPVQAQPDSVGYRLGKFIRRNRVATSVTVALVLSLLAGIVGIAWQGRRAALERDRARREAAKAKRVVALIQEVFRRASPYDPEAARNLSAVEVLEQGAESIRDQLTEEPETRAAIMGEIGWALSLVGRLESADSLLAEALEIERRELKPQDPELATTIHRFALVQDHLGRFEKAEELFGEALQIRETSPGTDHPDYADTLCQLAYQLSFSRPDQDAGDLFQRALAVFEKSGDEGTIPALTCRHNYGSMLRRTGHYEEAVRTFREALALSRSTYRYPLAEDLVTQESLALALRQQGELDEAEAIYLKVLDGKRKHLGLRHFTIGATLNNLAKLYEIKEQPAKAVPLYKEALEIFRSHLGDEHANVGVTIANLAVVRHKLGDQEDAERLFRQALRIYEKAVPEDHPYVGSALAGLGQLLNSSKRFTEAEPVLQKALTIRRTSLPPGDTHVVTVLLALSESLSSRRQYARSDHLLREALDELDADADAAAIQRICARHQDIASRGHLTSQPPSACLPAQPG